MNIVNSALRDFYIWLSLLLITILILIIGAGYWYHINHDTNPANDYRDRTYVTYIMLVLFALFLTINIINTIYLIKEFDYIITEITPHNNVGKLRFKVGGLLGEHIRNLEQIYEQPHDRDVDQQYSLSVIQNTVFRREVWVQVGCNLMITFGMIGTVVGLTMSVGGLSLSMDMLSKKVEQSLTTKITKNSPIQNQQLDQQQFGAGLNTALSGMSSAFITTLLGAVLGGVLLKLLSTSTHNLMEHLIDAIGLKTETCVLPHLQQSPDQILRRKIDVFTKISEQLQKSLEKETEHLVSISQRIQRLTTHYEQLAQAAKASAEVVNIPHHQLSLLKNIDAHLSFLCKIFEGKALIIFVSCAIFCMFLFIVSLSIIAGFYLLSIMK